jgi:DNA-binding MarR family transcriptional regulator
MSDEEPGAAAGRVRLGAALRRAWLGYRGRVTKELAAAGFDDRRFPDGRVLRLCAQSPEMTIAQLGRELGITRQGAGKVVASLSDRGYVSLRPSERDAREKIIELTPRAREFQAALREATRRVERELRAEVGPDGFEGLLRLLHALEGDERQRLPEVLRQVAHVDILGYLDD